MMGGSPSYLVGEFCPTHNRNKRLDFSIFLQFGEGKPYPPSTFRWLCLFLSDKVIQNHGSKNN